MILPEQNMIWYDVLPYHHKHTHAYECTHTYTKIVCTKTQMQTGFLYASVHTDNPSLLCSFSLRAESRPAQLLLLAWHHSSTNMWVSVGAQTCITLHYIQKT